MVEHRANSVEIRDKLYELIELIISFLIIMSDLNSITRLKGLMAAGLVSLGITK